MELKIGDARQLLEQEGDVNYLLEETLPDQPDFTKTYEIPGEESCTLCHIASPRQEDEKIFYNGPAYYIACTSGGPENGEMGWDDGRKGHEVRNMAVWHNHGVLPSISYMSYRDRNMLEHLRDITADHIDNGEMIVYGSMQTFTDHIHFVASDLETREYAESDLGSINNYVRYRVDDSIPSPMEAVSREKVGDYLLQALNIV